MEDQPMPGVVDARCGNCMAWKKLETQVGPVEVGAKARGVCFGAPPTAVAVRDKHQRITGQTVLRPCPAEDDTCLLFTPRPDLISGGVSPH